MLTLILIIMLLSWTGRRRWYYRRPMGFFSPWDMPRRWRRPPMGFGWGRPPMGGFGWGRGMGRWF